MTYVKGIYILTKKELKEMFTGPLVYLLSAIFCLIIGWLFFNYVIAQKETTNLGISGGIIGPTFGNMNFIFVFLAPLLTMKSFAHEKKMGTLDLLFKSQLTTSQIILAKFLAPLIITIFMLSLTIILPLTLTISGHDDFQVVILSYIGIILSVACYLAVGLFTSSITDHQLISALLGFSILLGSMFLVFTANASDNYLLGLIFQYMSVPFHYESFVRGILHSYNFIYFLSFITFFLILTYKAISSRNW